MLTTRINPKMSAKPLATMKSAPAKVSESSTMRKNEPGSWTAEPNVVVRQPPLPISGGVFVMKRMYARAKSTTAATTTRGARRQIERRSNMRSACALTEAT